MVTQGDLFTCAHISDLHFSTVQWGLAQFFSKRWVGNANVLFARQKAFNPASLHTLFPLFAKKKVDTVLITGDLSSTSHPKEFMQARAFVQQLRQEGLRVFVIPGNHDHYTKAAYTARLFYDFFPDRYEQACPESLAVEGVTSVPIAPGWRLCLLDTALATPLTSSRGLFSETIEQALESTLQRIPPGERVFLINHFPLFSCDSPRKELLRREALQALLGRYPCVTLFAH